MEIQVLKGIVLCSLFLTCLTASLLPLKFVNVAIKRDRGESRRHFVERVLRFLNCFGGGVFLATCLLDLLPDVERKLTAVFTKLDIRTNFPVAEFITAVGLFLILSVEQIAHDCKERTDGRRGKTTVVSVEKNDKGEHQQTNSVVNHVDEETKETETSPLLRHSTVLADSNCATTSDHSNEKSDGEGSINNYNTETVLSHESHGPSHGHSHGTLRGETGDTALIQHTDSHDMVTSSSLRSLLLLLALSLHSLFEGLALGLQSDVDQLLGIFAAVIIHKTILALSLGINFVQSNLKPLAIIQSSICFAIMAPIGIILGILVVREFDDTAHNITSGILQGLATGTFLYITFFEVLPMEMSQPGDRLLKVLCAMVGFGLIVGTMFLDPNISNPVPPV